MKIADEIVEAAAIKFCEAEGRDPHQMTYITDDGVTQPYGDAFQWFVEPMRAALESVAERIVAEAEAPTADPWRETVRDIYDELHFGKISLFTGSKLAKRLIGIIEDRHPGYFNEPPPDRDSARDRRPA